MRTFFTLLAISIFISGFSAEPNDIKSFSAKWKESSPSERREIADANKMYDLLEGKTKDQVKWGERQKHFPVW